MTVVETLSVGTCPPRFATPRTDRPTLGPAVGQVARILGKPFMPWQQYVADVVLEIDPRTGRLVYREFGLTVPRQSGKTTFILAKLVQRAMATKHFGPRQKIVYTAQTRKDARKKWEEDFVEDLVAAKRLRGKFTVRKSNGSEHVRFINGSLFGIDATTEKSGHGPTLDEGFIDEAFAQVDNRLEQAFKPAMITRSQPQLGVVSTAGWEGESPYLWDKVEQGRVSALAGRTQHRCYFEWSAPEDADPADRRVWWDCMPALGHTISVDAIAADFETMSTNEFRRAYLNHWVPKDAPDDPVIPPEVWAAKADPDSGRLSPVAFGVTVTPDRSRTTIGVGGRRGDGLDQVEVVAEGSGVDWAVDWLVERVSRWDPCAVILDGTALGLKDQLAEEGIDAESTSSQDRAQATVDFYDALAEDRLRHTGDKELAASVAGAQKRVIGDRWVWEGPGVAQVQAVTLALHGLLVYGKPAPPPASPQLASTEGAGAMSETADLARAGF